MDWIGLEVWVERKDRDEPKVRGGKETGACEEGDVVI